MSGLLRYTGGPFKRKFGTNHVFILDNTMNVPYGLSPSEATSIRENVDRYADYLRSEGYLVRVTVEPMDYYKVFAVWKSTTRVRKV